MVIRWLGAYGQFPGSVEEMLDFEFSAQTKAVCAERLIKGKTGLPRRTRLGLLCKNSAVVRRFKEDVYSLRNEQGYLYKTRKDCGGFGTHTEVWVKPQYIGIVVRDKWASVSKETQQQVRCAAKKFGCPIFVLANGQLNKMVFDKEGE